MVYMPQFLINVLSLLGLWTLSPTQDCGAVGICPQICSLHRAIWLREPRHKSLYTFLNVPAEAIATAESRNKPALVPEMINRAYEQTLASKYKSELGASQSCIEARQPLQKRGQPPDQVQTKPEKLPEECTSNTYKSADEALQLPFDVRHYLMSTWWRLAYDSWVREEFSTMDRAEEEARAPNSDSERKRASEKRRDEQSKYLHVRLGKMCNWPE